MRQVFETLNIRKERIIVNQVGPKIIQVYCLKRDSRPWHKEEESRWSLESSLS